MADYQKVVDDIQSLLSYDTEIPQDVFRALAERYAGAVRGANLRLRVCDDLLQKGLRSEAIQQSEAEPDLIELVTILDFPGREEWSGFVEQAGLERPPDLLIDIATDLNEAYAAAQPLAGLMRNHRLFALARSSLCSRIAIMRRIAQLDSDNPIWDEDIRLFEKTRHDQIKSEAEKAFRSGNLRVLGILEKEVRSRDWLEPPSAEAGKFIVDLHTRLRTESAKRELEMLEKKLTEAFSRLDVVAGRNLRSQWIARAEIGVVAEDSPLFELVAPALEWLRQEDARETAQADYDAAVAEMEQALDDGGDRRELERLFHRLLHSESGIPEVLERRLAERMLFLDVAGKRRARIFMVGVVMSILMIAGAIAFGIHRQSVIDEIGAIAGSVEALLDEGNIDGASKILDNLTVRQQDDPTIRRLMASVKSTHENEQGREELLAQHMKQANSWFDNPELGTVHLASAALRKASDIAKTDVEKTRIAQLTMDIQAKADALQESIDVAFREDFDKLVARFKQTDPNDRVGLSVLLGETQALSSRTGMSASLARNLTTLITNIQTKVHAIEIRNDRDQALDRITAAVGDRLEFATRLREYVDEFKDTPRALAFQSVTKEEEQIWEGIDAWNVLIDRWQQKDLRSISPEQAALCVTEAEELLKKYGGFPDAAKLNGLVEYLKAITCRSNDKGELHLQLAETLNTPMLADFRMVLTKDNERYYFKKDPVFFAARDFWWFYYVIDVAGTETKRIEISAERIDFDGVQDKTAWPAPSTEFATRATELLNKLNSTNWEETFLQIQELLRGDNRIDPILKLQLMTEVLRVACTGSRCLALVFEKQLARLENAPVDYSANWINPGDGDGKRAREAAQRLIAGLQPMDEAKLQVNQLLSQLNSPELGCRHRPVGWLYRDDEGHWDLLSGGRLESVFGSQVTKREPLVVVLQNPGDGSPKFCEIGYYDGTVTVDTAAAALKEGRPVFSVDAGPQGSSSR